MNKYEFAEIIKNAEVVEKVSFIQNLCRDRAVLDLGCIRHNADFAKNDPNWLHKKIQEVAKTLIGIDYLKAEVIKLQDLGYNIHYGDVTKPLLLNEQFDVIVAGDLIEHLTNFESFFENCTKLLKNGGILIISTPNPFFSDEFHYISYKRNFLINPEHTCWIDPLALSQLAQRCGFQIVDIHYLKNSWYLGDLMCEGKNFRYDILNDRWSKNSFVSKILRHIISTIFSVVYIPFKYITMTNTKLVKHSDYISVLMKY